MSSHFLCFLHKLVKTQVTPLAQNVQAEVCVCVCLCTSKHLCLCIALHPAWTRPTVYRLHMCASR